MDRIRDRVAIRKLIGFAGSADTRDSAHRPTICVVDGPFGVPTFVVGVVVVVLLLQLLWVVFLRLQAASRAAGPLGAGPPAPT